MMGAKVDGAAAGGSVLDSALGLVWKVISNLIKISLLGYACVVAYRIRLYPVEEYGPLIHEFDPWFNYRAAEYLLHNGRERFFKWFDHEVWYPIGRPVGTTIYPGMQFSAVWIYELLNNMLPHGDYATPFPLRVIMPFLPTSWEVAPMSLNDICCYMPCWWAAAATFLMGAWTYECTGRGWGSVIAALIFAVLPAHLMRSVAGEFDNECVAVAAIVGTFWLWCASVRYEHRWPIAIAAGFAYWYMVASWGGYIFVINMIGIHALCLIPLGFFNDGTYKAYTLFYIIGTYLATTIPVVGLTPIKSMEQMGPLGVFLIYQFLQATEMYNRSLKANSMDWWELQRFRAKMAVVAGGVLCVIVSILLPMGYFGPLSSRIRGLFVKHTRTGNPLVDSVAEHQPASAAAYNHYLHHAVTPAFFGFVLCLPKIVRSPGHLFLALYCVVSYYFSLKMSRLMIICGPIVASCAGYFIGASFLYLTGMIYKTSMKFFLGVEVAMPGDDEVAADDSAPSTRAESRRGSKDSTAAKDEAPSLPKKNSSGLSKRQLKKTISAKQNASKVELTASIGKFQQEISDYWNADSMTGARFLICMCMFVFMLQQTVTGGLEFNAHGHRMAMSLANPQIVFKYTDRRSGQKVLIDDYYQSYLWLKENTPEDSRVLSWWDYGYQINGIANRTTVADGNTWNHEHIATLGRCMVSPEKRSWNIIRHLADYVLVWAGGSGDDLGKSVHMARISTSVYDDVCPDDPTCQRFGFNSDGSPTEMMSNSLVYKLHSHKLKPGVRADPRLWKEVHTTKNGLVRIFQVQNISEESRDWVQQNRECDGGGWYCPGQYPPALDKLFNKRKDFAQLEDFNSGNKEKNAYSKLVDERGGKI